MKKIFIVLLFIILAAITVMTYFYVTQKAPAPEPSNAVTDCDVKSKGLKRGIDWEYVNPSDANRVTADCVFVKLIKR